VKVFIEVDQEIVVSMSGAKMSKEDKLRFCSAFRSIGNVILKEIEANEKEFYTYEIDELKPVARYKLTKEWVKV